MSGFGNLLTNPVLLPLGGGKPPKKTKGKHQPGHQYFAGTGPYGMGVAHPGGAPMAPANPIVSPIFGTDPISGPAHRQAVNKIVRGVQVSTPAAGSRTAGSGAAPRGSRLAAVKPSGGRRASGTRLPAGTPGGTGAGMLATTGTAKAGSKLAGAGKAPAPKAASTPAAAQKSIEQIVDDMIAGNITQNQRATTAYQASNKTLRDGLVAQSSALNGAMPTLNPTQAAVNADGTVNTDAQGAAARANAVGAAQGSAITNFVGQRQQANNTLLAGLGDVAGQRAVEYAQTQRAQKPGLVSQMQAADDKKQMDLAQMSLAARQLGDKESADSYDRQLKALQLQQQGAYQQGQLALGASRIDATNANAATRNAAAATKFGLQMSQKQADLAQRIYSQNFMQKPIKQPDGSTTYQTVYPKNPWRAAFGQLANAGFSPEQAAMMASNWTEPLGHTFRPDHERGVYQMIANRTGNRRLALNLVRQHFHEPEWTPDGAPKVVKQALGVFGAR